MPYPKGYTGRLPRIPSYETMPMSFFTDITDPHTRERVLHYGQLGWRYIYVVTRGALRGALRGIPPQCNRFEDVPPDVPPAPVWQHPSGKIVRGGIVCHILSLDDNAKIPTPEDRVRPEPSEAASKKRDRTKIHHIHAAFHPVSIPEIVDSTLQPHNGHQLRVLLELESTWEARQEGVKDIRLGSILPALEQIVTEASDNVRRRGKRVENYRPHQLTAVVNPEGTVDLFNDDGSLAITIPANSPLKPKHGDESVRIHGVRRFLFWGGTEKTDEKN